MTAIETDLSQDPRAQRENGRPRILSLFGERKPRDVDVPRSAASPTADPTPATPGFKQKPAGVPSAQFEKVFAGLSGLQDIPSVRKEPSPSVVPVEALLTPSPKSLDEEFDEIEALTSQPRTSPPLTFVPGPFHAHDQRLDPAPPPRQLPHPDLPKPDLARHSSSEEVTAALATLERVHADIAREKASTEALVLRQQQEIQNLLAEAEKRDAQIDAMQADIDDMRLTLSSERRRLHEFEKQSRAQELINTKMKSVVERARQAAEQAQLERDEISQIYEQERTNNSRLLTSITNLIQNSQTA